MCRMSVATAFNYSRDVTVVLLYCCITSLSAQFLRPRRQLCEFLWRTLKTAALGSDEQMFVRVMIQCMPIAPPPSSAGASTTSCGYYHFGLHVRGSLCLYVFGIMPVSLFLMHSSHWPGKSGNTRVNFVDVRGKNRTYYQILQLLL